MLTFQLYIALWVGAEELELKLPPSDDGHVQVMVVASLALTSSNCGLLLFL